MNNPMDPNKETSQYLELLRKDSRCRKASAERSHPLFFSVYLSRYATFPFAPLHTALFDMTERDDKYSVVQAFRASGKSTIATFSYPMWAVLGRQQKRFVLIVSANEELAQRHLDNIKREFEENSTLRGDFGVAHEEETPWNSRALTFKNKQAMITAISIDQSVRGIRFQGARPDLIIFDDIEDRDAMKTKQGRDKVFTAIMSDFAPSGALKNKKMVFVGSNLHADSPINRVKDSITQNPNIGRSYFFPIVDEQGQSAWPAAFPDAASIEVYRQTVVDPVAWQTEYMLNPISPEDQIVKPDTIQYYTQGDRPNLHNGFIVIGVDPAIKKGPNNDYTGIVPVFVTGSGTQIRYYVLDRIENRRLGASEAIAAIKAIRTQYAQYTCHVVIEDVGFQSMLIEQLKREGCRNIYGFKPGARSKTERLYGISSLFETGHIAFPEKGAKDLVQQIIGQGVEKHDDLLDALTTAILGAREAKLRQMSGGVAGFDGRGGCDMHFVNSAKQNPALPPAEVDRTKIPASICLSREEEEVQMRRYVEAYKKENDGRLPGNVGPFGFLLY